MFLMTTTITKSLGRIYLVLPFLKILKIGETINRYVQDGGDIDIGTVIEILILNRLCGFHTPLYAMAEWAEKHGVDEIYGIDAKKLNDDRIGDALDKVFRQLDTLDSQLTVNLLKAFDVNVDQIHFDASSFAVSGKEAACAGDPRSLHVTYGRDGKGNTNHRQVRFGLAVTGSGNIPLLGKAYSGNTMDYEMHPEFLKDLLKMVTGSGFLFVSDSKFDSKSNFIYIFTHIGTFLCPGVLREEVQEEFLEFLEQGKIEWQELDYVSKADKKKAKGRRPYYRAFEKVEEIRFEIKGEERINFYRVIFVYSSAKAALQKKTRDKRIKRIAAELEKIKSRLNTREYKTREYIEKKVAQVLALNEMGKLFEYEIVERNGRFSLDYRIKSAEREKLEKLDGIYLLKTNLPKETHSLDKVFRIYKQQSQIEHRIKVIKGPLKLAPIFLKDPKRIAAMFFVLVQALKIYSIIEWKTRNALEEQKKPASLLPEGRKTMAPSGETILRAFDQSVSILIDHDDEGNKIIKLTKPNATQLLIFQLLEIKPPDLRSLSRKFGRYPNKGSP